MPYSGADDESASDILDGGLIVFEHALTEIAGNKVECTIFPRGCNEEEILTHWITARENAFVSVESMR